MIKTVIVKNPTDNQVNILLPKFRIDLRIGPKSESDPLPESVVKHIDPYVKAFKLEVVESNVEVSKKAEVATQPAPQAPAKVEEPKAPPVEAKVEAPAAEKVETQEAPASEGSDKKYEEAELFAMVKAELVAICQAKSLDAGGVKEDLVKRILESQVG